MVERRWTETGRNPAQIRAVSGIQRIGQAVATKEAVKAGKPYRAGLRMRCFRGQAIASYSTCASTE